jgi:hypothetical protein
MKLTAQQWRGTTLKAPRRHRLRHGFPDTACRSTASIRCTAAFSSSNACWAMSRSGASHLYRAPPLWPLLTERRLLRHGERPSFRYRVPLRPRGYLGSSADVLQKVSQVETPFEPSARSTVRPVYRAQVLLALRGEDSQRSSKGLLGRVCPTGARRKIRRGEFCPHLLSRIQARAEIRSACASPSSSRPAPLLRAQP